MKLAVLVALALTAHMARAHEVVHEVARGRSIALHVLYADGTPVAYAAAEVFSPQDAAIQHQKGRTDRSGWVSFVPDVPGSWHVKVVDATGHGLDTVVGVLESDLVGRASVGDAPSHQASYILPALRVIASIVGIGVVFAALTSYYRRKEKAR